MKKFLSLQILKYALRRAKNPVLFLSGGADSLLVLEMLKELNAEFECITFRQDFTDGQWKQIENLILKFDLELYTYPVKHSYAVLNDGLARVDEYSLGRFDFPVVRDFIHSDTRCALEADSDRLDFFEFDYDVIFTGARRDDYSKLTGKSPLGRHPFNRRGAYLFVNPLCYWTKDEVTQKVGSDFIDMDLAACSRCLSNDVRVFCPKDGEWIPTPKWNPAATTRKFKEKYLCSVI